MLVISRKKGESFNINKETTVTVLSITKTQAKIGIQAPENVTVLREEIEEKFKNSYFVNIHYNKGYSLDFDVGVAVPYNSILIEDPYYNCSYKESSVTLCIFKDNVFVSKNLTNDQKKKDIYDLRFHSSIESRKDKFPYVYNAINELFSLLETKEIL